MRTGVSPSLVSEIQAVLFPLAVALSALVAKLVYFDLMPRQDFDLSLYLGAGLLAALIMGLISNETDANSVPAILQGRFHGRALFVSVSLSFLILLGLFYLLKMSTNFSRGWFMLWYFTSLGFVFSVRFGILLWARLLKAERRLLERVAIYGSPDLGLRVRETLFANNHNLIFAGIYADAIGPSLKNARVAGNMQTLIALAQRGGCDRVIIALPRNADEDIREAVAQLDVLPIDVQLSPDAMHIPVEVQGAKDSSGLVLLDLQRRPLSARGLVIKTVMDYAIAAVAVVLFAPVMAVIAAAIKLTSPGPVFFIQSRHGYNHKIIRVMKFRTMTVAEDGAVVTQAVRGDKRVTRVGRFLRRSSLDELPQLFNVLMGDLSLVGPRPHAVAHNESYSQLLSSYATRHKVKPGITGLAQVNGCRGETKTPEDMQRRVEYDLEYIKHWSPWLDVQILAKTILVPLFGSNAY